MLTVRIIVLLRIVLYGLLGRFSAFLACDSLDRRLRVYVERSEALKPEAARLFEDVLMRGEFDREKPRVSTGLLRSLLKAIFRLREDHLVGFANSHRLLRISPCRERKLAGRGKSAKPSHVSDSR